MTIVNGQTLTTGTWLRVLRGLNPNLRVYCGNNDSRLAGLYLINKHGEIEDICGVDKSYVPCYTSFDDGGHVVKSGWRRVIWILLTHNFTTREQINRVCRGFFDSRACAADRFTGGIQGDPIENKILRYSLNAPVRKWRDPDTKEIKEGTVLTDEQNLDIAEDIREKDNDATKETREQEKWFLETWKKRGGNPSDKPQV